MTILVPYVEGMLHERTRAWWAEPRSHEEQRPELADLPVSDDTAYWRLLAAYWRVTEPIQHDLYEAPTTPDLVVVEQDIVPAPGVVERMLACPRPWCASPYPISGGHLLDTGLGCTKFAARLKSRHLDFMDRVGLIDDDGLPAKNWRRLDVRIARTLRELGYRPHRHARSEHLHDYRARP